LRMAEQLGADKVFDASDASVGSTIRYEHGGAKCAICCAPSLKAYEQAMFSLRPTGTLVAIGLPAGNVELPVLNTVFWGISVVGSFIGGREVLKEALAFAARGRVKSLYQTYRLDQVNEAVSKLKTGSVKGRPVMLIGER